MIERLVSLFRPRLEEPAAEDERPEWVEEILEAIQKQSRATVKQTAKLEGTLGEGQVLLRTLGQAIEQQNAPVRAVDSQAAAREHAPLFDALDALEEATRLATEPQVAAGLSRVGERITSFCERAGFSRVQGRGAAPDPRLMRVVGSEPSPGVPVGHVTRVVRAAILRGGQVVREGEVIIAAEESRHEQLGH